MTTKEHVHELVDALSESAADEVLDYLRWLISPTDTLTEQEFEAVQKGERQVESGDYMTLEELKVKLGI
jgi:hypothetical protein